MLGVTGEGFNWPSILSSWATSSTTAALALWVIIDQRKRLQAADDRVAAAEARVREVMESRLADQREMLPLLGQAAEAIERGGQATRAAVETPLLPADVARVVRRMERVLDDFEGGR